MTPNVSRFDRWIRTSFVEINTELETLYFAQENKAAVTFTGAALKQQLLAEGCAFIIDLLNEGNTDEGFEEGFNLLGNVGLYLAACRRHEIDEANQNIMKEASSLALQLGASLGVTPRFATSHLTTHNTAFNGRYKTFTSLEDEAIFIDYNTRGIFSYKRAADALLRIMPLGVSHPVAPDLFKAAKDALYDVIAYNKTLFKKLDTDRFFYNVRPYYKPHRVGASVYRGANAGDFAGINVIDLLLGLCRAENASYSQMLVDKFLYMMPQDQLLLRDCMRQKSMMNSFLEALPANSKSPWFQENLKAFLDVCDAHGEAAAQHHDQLVGKYISQPAVNLPEENHSNLTASGPPLPVLLAVLEKLRDQRMAAPRNDIETRYKDIQLLKAAITE
ncbi:DUF1864 family protein [Pedobacter sp. HMF7647]|uniref:DUF1864 family protein n=1 Tax=Hufsiella arboris TaxID=2695275 RepID=A0A7K1Y8W7_9SPHI|nr:monodechloroaminopyrrolnitrin synthase PrnB family protein [Hufsiella arboris]MXV51025.1 DUF1864 family protein [Hufsiella arboris]